MSKRSEEAVLKLFPIQMELVPQFDGGIIEEDVNRWKRMYAKIGYELAEKDTIAKIREQVEKWMPNNPEGDEYTSGERVAFRSVLHLLKEMEEEL